MPVSKKRVVWIEMGQTSPPEVLLEIDQKLAISLFFMEAMMQNNALGGRIFIGMTGMKGGESFCFQEYLHIGEARFLGENAKRFIDSITAASPADSLFPGRRNCIIHKKWSPCF